MELKEPATFEEAALDMPTELTTYFPESLAKAQMGSQVGSKEIQHRVEKTLLECAQLSTSRYLEDWSRWKLGQVLSNRKPLTLKEREYLQEK